MQLRLWREEVGLVTPVSAAHQRHDSRPHLFLEVRDDDAFGLGEISPQPHDLNGDPGVDDVLVELEHFTLRQFAEVARREGATPHWARVAHFAGSRRASRPASALLEMALLDAQLRSEGRTIEDQWVARYDTPEQVTVSLLDHEPWTAMGRAHQVRAKVSAAALTSPRWSELAGLGRPVMLDFNCSARDAHDVVEVLEVASRHVDVVCVEQPFAAGNVVDHARLAERLDVPVSIDEGMRSRRDLDQIVRYGAASWICVKPARVGGYAQARTLIERARSLGLEVYLGGFFESPLARRATRALARHLVSRASDIADPPLERLDLLREAPGGCGFRAGPGLEGSKPLVSVRW